MTHLNSGVDSRASSPTRVIVMTGGSSGLGAIATRRFLDAGASVIMASRGPVPMGVQRISADLTCLGNVREFAKQVETYLEERSISSIDALVLNAGGYGEGRTSEGYDRIFVLNYLAHYLLVELLLPRISVGGRIIATTSGTHDPAEKSLAPAPRHANALWLALPELDPELPRSSRIAAMQAYASAKLCVVLRARALSLSQRVCSRGITSLAYDPGPTPGTGLVRGQSAPLRLLWERFPFVIRWLMRKKANTVRDAGRALADLALGISVPPNGEIYAALRAGRMTWPALSLHARRDDLMKDLERDSASLLGHGLAAIEQVDSDGLAGARRALSEPRRLGREP